MLHAMLHGKLRRPADTDDDRSADASAWDQLTAHEDPLTSAVFSPLAYLDPADAWALLRAASLPPPGADPFPAAVPAGPPSLRFWPRLSPPEGSDHSRHIEPDVLIDWGSHLILVEAKHAATQNTAQWVGQIRALRADRRFAARPLLFIAAGGADPASFALHVADARAQLLGDAIAFFLLPWRLLRDQAAARAPSPPGGAAAILADLIAALEAWDYRRRLGFDSLPAAARGLSIATTPAALTTWSLR
jgi:hypothetical protein